MHYNREKFVPKRRLHKRRRPAIFIVTSCE